ncbi:hypothetical protein PoB_006182100 [Plakobranchus ocellatus]|uniref:Uncharacterized protein n=1 Tax=Plakobranchus ocellatus TaxID=259542 RepID=A0AAV4CTX3_9GAST|nr:hypothetical protein PoB_006182100 [Plakobranchus ocellatus]
MDVLKPHKNNPLVEWLRMFCNSHKQKSSNGAARNILQPAQTSIHRIVARDYVQLTQTKIHRYGVAVDVQQPTQTTIHWHSGEGYSVPHTNSNLPV